MNKNERQRRRTLIDQAFEIERRKSDRRLWHEYDSLVQEINALKPQVQSLWLQLASREEETLQVVEANITQASNYHSAIQELTGLYRRYSQVCRLLHIEPKKGLSNE